MKVNSQKIIQMLMDMWPNLTYNFPNASSIFLEDGTYYLPSKDKVESMIRRAELSERYKYHLEWMDCGDYALIMHSFVVQKRYKRIIKEKLDKSRWYPWAFGECWGSKFNGKLVWHAINIAITSDKGIILIEPQAEGAYTWEPSRESDVVHFIQM